MLKIKANLVNIKYATSAITQVHQSLFSSLNATVDQIQIKSVPKIYFYFFSTP